MSYPVFLTLEAEKDLLDLHAFIAAHDSPAKADALLTRLEDMGAELARLPDRGHVPPELKRIGVAGYRAVHCKPYRVIYGIAGKQVHVHAVLDGRRDLQSLLERRLLR